MGDAAGRECWGQVVKDCLHVKEYDPCHHHIKLVILRNHMKSKVSLLNLFLF